MKLSRALAAASLVAHTVALAIGGQNLHVKRGSDGLQDIVTYDEHSLMVHGVRILIFSGEVHPYRLPVPGLYLDVFQKIKALGFSAVSFYVHWALLEGEPGVYSASGVLALEPFLEAASEAGIYLIARPGPYINAEASGGGFPGWLQRLQGQLRTRAPDYLKATDNYVAHVGATIAKYQITNGGPVILLQPENEYSGGIAGAPTYFPDPVYMDYVEKQYRDAGIVVPFTFNDAWAQGHFSPGWEKPNTTYGTLGDIDIYGYDNYPLGFDCANPTIWPPGKFPTSYTSSNARLNPFGFNAMPEFQGGSFDPWGGPGFDGCAALLNMEFERVFYKNVFASHTPLLSIYMTYGGTNWGNLGHSGGYTSYDYGSALTENRGIYREKYSELKLEANFMKVSPAYLTASPGVLTNSSYSNTPLITTTPVLGNGTATNFYVVRHSDYEGITSVSYTMTVPTSKGVKSVPQIGNTLLTLGARDSKWLVTDYDIGGTTLLYSTAEIFTWKKYNEKIVLVVYGAVDEQHELSIITHAPVQILEGSGVVSKAENDTQILNWKTSTTRRVVKVGDVFVYILDRNTVYNYWVPDFERSDAWGRYTANPGNTTSVIVQAGYLVRSAYMEGSTLHIEGDLNATVPIAVIGAPASTTELYFNTLKLNFKKDQATGDLSSTLEYHPQKINLPNLSTLQWKYVDNLPEVQPTYDASPWTAADLTKTYNPTRNLTTPTSLYAGDYGYHAGALIYRGEFTASGAESAFSVETQGGSAFGNSVWINDTYVGSWPGIDKSSSHNDTYTLPNLKAGKPYVITVVVDNNGLNEDWYVGGDDQKTPRGILNYNLTSHDQADITWKLTGNLGGEKYVDKARGPLNEGGLYAERQGFTQPNPPNRNWANSSPMTGIKKAGIAFYQTSFDLDLPENYDIPLTFNFGNTTMDGATANYQAQLYVNGYQFGKYINNIGPQSKFPVPQGILDYSGTNWIAVEIWARQANGAKLTDFTLEAGSPVWTSYQAPQNVPKPSYTKRAGAY